MFRGHRMKDARENFINDMSTVVTRYLEEHELSYEAVLSGITHLATILIQASSNTDTVKLHIAKMISDLMINEIKTNPNTIRSHTH